MPRGWQGTVPAGEKQNHVRRKYSLGQRCFCLVAESFPSASPEDGGHHLHKACRQAGRRACGFEHTQLSVSTSYGNRNTPAGQAAEGAAVSDIAAHVGSTATCGQQNMRDSKQQQQSWAGGGRRVSWAHFKNAAHNRQCLGQACAAADVCAAHLCSAAPLRCRGTERCETPSCRGTRWAAQRQQQGQQWVGGAGRQESRTSEEQLPAGSVWAREKLARWRSQTVCDPHSWLAVLAARCCRGKQGSSHTG